MMNSFVIFSLIGDYSKVEEEIEKEIGSSNQLIDKLSYEDLKGIAKSSIEKNNENEETIRLLKEELNELYLKYDTLCAAYGEMNHFVQEASKIPSRHSIEK